MEKITLVEALDRRKILHKRIYDRIQQAQFVEWHKHNQPGTSVKNQNVTEFKANAKKEYQGIQEQIAYYNRLNQAISKANAESMIQTSVGKMSISAVVVLRNRIQNGGSLKSIDDRTDFEEALAKKMQLEMQATLAEIDNKNEKMMVSADTMRNSILSKENKGKGEDATALAVVDTYLNGNRAELIDPIDVDRKCTEIREKMEALVAELNMKLKIANATVEIEIA